MSMKSELVKIVLWACIEDYAGLWELLWEANSGFPEISEDDRRRLTYEVVLLLLNRGAIKLYRCQEPCQSISELDMESATLALNLKGNWDSPDFEGASIRVGATKSGEGLYSEGGI